MISYTAGEEKPLLPHGDPTTKPKLQPFIPQDINWAPQLSAMPRGDAEDRTDAPPLKVDNDETQGIGIFLTISLYCASQSWHEQVGIGISKWCKVNISKSIENFCKYLQAGLYDSDRYIGRKKMDELSFDNMCHFTGNLMLLNTNSKLNYEANGPGRFSNVMGIIELQSQSAYPLLLYNVSGTRVFRSLGLTP